MTLLEPKIEKSPTCFKFENFDPDPQLDIKIETPKKKPKEKTKLKYWLASLGTSHQTSRKLKPPTKTYFNPSIFFIKSFLKKNLFKILLKKQILKPQRKNKNSVR